MALYIPLVITIRLGQLDRNGLLIATKLGPRVRLAKVFTNLPLATDSFLPSADSEGGDDTLLQYRRRLSNGNDQEAES
jgi:hypothetical protein